MSRHKLGASRIETTTVEVLTFAGCPHADPTVTLVERVVRQLGVEAQVTRIDVESDADAERLRFLGSPTVRVNGLDVEPGAQERNDYALSCRVYRTGSGFSGQPDEAWLREALQR